MKKIIFAAAALFAFGFANAQDTTEESAGGKGFANGDVFISGAVSISSTSHGDEKENMFEIEPKVGFFVSDNIAVGGKIGYMSEKNEDAGGNTTLDDSTLSIGVFGRYYTTPASDFSFFAQLGFDYMTTDHGDADYKTNGFDIALSPGISYFVSDNWALEAQFGRLGYTTTKDDFDGAESTDTFGLGVDLRSVSIGLIYKF
jgi:outer membrane protein